MTSPSPPSSPLSIRDARAPDAASVTTLLRAGVPERLLSLMPLGQVGAEAWLADRLACSARPSPGERHSETPTSRFRVAVAGPAFSSKVVGVAEWRIVDDDLFLNQIGVHSARRGQGIGTRLLRDGLEHNPNRPTLTLDVFSTNDRARRWYERLGFILQASNVWAEYSPAVVKAFAGDSGTVPNIPDALVEGLDAADEMHAAYGFSSFRLRAAPSASRTPEMFRVGRLGATHFRITARRILRWRHLWSLLHAIDPARGILYIGPPLGAKDRKSEGAKSQDVQNEDGENTHFGRGELSKGRLPDRARLLASSFRLGADPSTVRSRLSSPSTPSS